MKVLTTNEMRKVYDRFFIRNGTVLNATTAFREIEKSCIAKLGKPVAWQWLDTTNFRAKLPADANKSEWHPLYKLPEAVK